jgi:hypothetical protein
MFCRESFTKPLIIAAIMAVYAIVYDKFDINSSALHFTGLMITGLLGVVLIWLFGISVSERKFCLEYVTKIVKG